MRTWLAVGATGVVVLAGGVGVAIQHNDTACERYTAAAERKDYVSFEQEQAALAKGLAECYAEEAKGNR